MSRSKRDSWVRAAVLTAIVFVPLLGLIAPADRFGYLVGAAIMGAGMLVVYEDE